MEYLERTLTCQSSRETHADALQIGAETLRLVEVQYLGMGCCKIQRTMLGGKRGLRAFRIVKEELVVP